MEIRQVEDLIFEHFPFEATEGQRILILALSDFIINHRQQEAFLFKGYAGTGKTTILSALVKAAPALHLKTVLLAPTGRAAKVMASYSGKQAFTIHKKIYMPRATTDGSVYMQRMDNLHTNTLFIIDEASMIPGTPTNDGRFYSDTDLLSDLVEYVYSGKNCSLILIGDTAQLPPVGADVSPAMDSKYIETAFNLRIRKLELREVMRQSLESGILANATFIREKIAAEDFTLPIFHLQHFPDIKSIDSSELEDALMFAHKDYGDDKTIVITRSNKRANVYNREIRNRILFREEEISTGDYLMVVRNNYYWLPKESPAGFIANGDIIEVQKIRKITEIYGFRFADAVIRLVDYPDHPEIETKLLLNTITADTPALSSQDNQRFFDEVMKDYEDIPERRRKMEKVKNNPWFNALQVKFAYALTCHKTQGGQWETIFIDQPWLPDNTIDKEFLRWLYTAVTRATKQVYLVNFKEEFFQHDSA
ncbi:MAG: AAA family ATPase [Bacteroidales bacterium]|nr:AAA family ATPase [Bacteroidales bacterium]